MPLGECDHVATSSFSDVGTERGNYKKGIWIKFHVIGSATCMGKGRGIVTGNRDVLLCVCGPPQPTSCSV
jgi:hypothetical protein